MIILSFQAQTKIKFKHMEAQTIQKGSKIRKLAQKWNNKINLKEQKLNKTVN